MSLSHSRLNGSALRLTPSHSPRTPASRSPTRQAPSSPHKDVPSLALKQVIGTTTADNTAFDCVPSARCFAFTAGAAAVLATVETDANGEHNITKRFFRAKPSSFLPAGTTGTPGSIAYDSPTPFSGNRSRLGRESNFGPLSSFDQTDSPSGRSGGSKDRMKAATCVSLSPDGQLLAVGETGYRPRVLIFSTAKEGLCSDSPLATISEHTFGVRCLAFSPDSKYLATLGDMNDGFLYIWSISRTGTPSCILTNKCTSNVRHIAWLGSSVITCGTRHVKIWRIDKQPAKFSPAKLAKRVSDMHWSLSSSVSSNRRMSDANWSLASPASTSKALAGRNLLLGPLLDKTFTAIVEVCPGKAVVCSDQGDVCILDDTGVSPCFYKVADVGFGVTSLAILKDSLVAAGESGQLASFKVETLISPALAGSNIPHTSISEGVACMIVAVAAIDNALITCNAEREIHILHAGREADSPTKIRLAHQSPAHGAAVQGVVALALPNTIDAAFYTWSSEGAVLFWSLDGQLKKSVNICLEQIDSGDGIVNELRVVRLSKDMSYAVTGDRFGLLRIIDTASEESIVDLKAHSSEIMDITIDESDERVLIASCGRDRMVQLFEYKDGSCDLLQTLDEHVGAVTALNFTSGGQRLISCSADRSIVVRDAVNGSVRGRITTAYVAMRTITLKATPLSMIMHENDKIVTVSATDRYVYSYEVNSGTLLSSFKTGDQDGGDAVILSGIAHEPRNKQPSLIAGVSGTDKSIRIYDDTGRLLSRDYGHTEGMTGIAIISDGTCSSSRNTESSPSGNKKSLVTVATDGTIFIWNLVSEVDQVQTLLENLSLNRRNSLVLTKPPLRRVISSTDLADLLESGEDSLTPLASPNLLKQSVRRKTSRLSMNPVPKLEPIPDTISRREGDAKTLSADSFDQSGRMSPPRHRRMSARPSFRRASSAIDLSASYRERDRERERERERPVARGRWKDREHGLIRDKENKSPLRASADTITHTKPQPPPSPPLSTSSRTSTTTTPVHTTATSSNSSSSTTPSLQLATDQMIKSLHTYRKHLTSSPTATSSPAATIRLETLSHLARELQLTTRAVTSRIKEHSAQITTSSPIDTPTQPQPKAQSSFPVTSTSPNTKNNSASPVSAVSLGGTPTLADDEALAALLEQYSDRLVGLLNVDLDRRVEACVASALEEAKSAGGQVQVVRAHAVDQ